MKWRNLVLFKTIVDMNCSGIIYTDVYTKVNVIDQAAECLLGIKSNQVVGKRLKIVIPSLLKEYNTLSKNEAKYNILFEYNATKYVADIVPVILNGETMGYMIALEM